MLTDMMLERYSPKGKREILWDSGGLGIRIGEKKRTWVFRYSFNGKRALMKIGIYPSMKLKEARAKAAKAALDVEHGTDPAVARKVEKHAHKAAPTFEDIVNEFWEKELNKQKSGKDRHRLLMKDVVPEWGKLKVADIKRRHIVLLLDGIEKRSKSTRNHVHGVLGRLFNFAAERGVIEDSPCTRIRKPKESPKNRVLTDDEIKLVWEALRPDNATVNIHGVIKLALKTILLTGQRPGEVVGMSWEELTPAGFWTIPAGRMKGAEAHRVPLCPMVLEVIETARSLSGDSRYVFGSPCNDAPVTRAALSRAIKGDDSENIKAWKKSRQKYSHAANWKKIGLKEPFTPHDLRRTLRTRLAELGVSDMVAERVIGHKLQGVLGVYNRHSYDMEKRQALEKWEAKLRAIVGLEKPEAAKVILMER